MLRLLKEKIATPLGPLWVICDEQFRLRAVEWEEYSERMVQLLDIHYRKEGYRAHFCHQPRRFKRRLIIILPVILALSIRFPLPQGGARFGEVLGARISLRAGNALRPTG